jgi:VanZ family protein
MRLRCPLLPGWTRWLGVLSVAVGIFSLSILAVPPAQVAPKPEFVPLDKWRHFLAYGAFGYALAYALADAPLTRRRKALVVLAVTALYGGGIEIGQSVLPRRYFGVGDFIANQIGAALSLTWYALEPRLRFVPLSAFVGSD